MFSNILGGAAGFPVADLGDTVSQSLRFTGSQELNSSLSYTSNASLTFSFWVKIANSLANGPYIFQGDIGASSIGFIGLRQSGTATGNGALTLNWQNSSTVNGRYRDPAAWYHFVISATSSSVKVYVNGVERLDHTPSSTYRVDHPGFGTDGFEGYLADIHCIDGSALQPTSFGRYQEDGVWVPKNYTGTYGTNGFHLDFADSSNPGNDVSGNNNDFTATGFDTAAVALYSAQTTATNGGFNASFPATNMFDGSLGTMALAASSNGVITFEPSTAIAFTNGVHMNVNHTAGDPGEFRVTVDGTTGTFTTFPTPANSSTALVNQIATGSGNLEKIEVRRTGVDNPAVVAIGINGTATSNILVDNTDNDVDFLDTPTSNYATGNPLHKHGTLAKANLGFGGSATHEKTSGTIALPDSGKYYWEFVHSAQYSYVGFMDAAINQGTSSPNSTGYWRVSSDGQVYTNGSFTTNIPSSGAVAWTNGDIIGFQYDRSNDEFRVYKNNSLYYTFTLPAVGDYTLLPLLGNYNNTNTFNFGQHPFIYTIPTGFSALQTNNLAEPTIKNGKDHFDVVTWTGDGTSGRDITGLNFQPDFVWMKARSSAYHNRLYDVIRGINVSLVSDANFIDGLNIPSLTAFNSDGFEIGTETDYNQSNETYVAWCWKGGGTAVSNTDGTVTSSVSANTDAGFSIVSYTGGGDASTVGHGLDRAPEFILFKAREQVGGTNQNWNVYHHSVGNNQVGFLNLNNAFTSDDFLNSTTPTSSVIEFGTSNSVSASGTDYIAYCWHSVEGYSKIGSFSGNANADGPFIYLGFRPSFFLWKRTDSTGSWGMIDSTRNTHNPLGQQLFPNTTDSEATYTICDFLSNGIKMRNSFGDTNTGTIAFLAFAENPFGGENAAPATAR